MATSLVAAALLKYDGLSATNFPSATRPPIAFDEMPRVDSSGADLDPEAGFVVLRDNGQKVQILGTEWQTLEQAEMVFEVYYPQLADVDTAVLAIKRNGGTTAQATGFDFATLEDLTTPRTTFICIRTMEKRSKEVGRGKTGKLMHCCRIYYTLVARESA